MAHLLRLICAALLLGSSLPSAFSAVPVVSGFGVHHPAGVSSYGLTQQEACANFAAVGQGLYEGVVTTVYYSSTTCRVYEGSAYRIGLKMPAAYICPANSSPSGSQCACDAGYEENGGACEVVQSDVERFCAGSAGVPDVSQQFKTSTSTPPSVACGETMYLDNPQGCFGTFKRDFAAMGDDGSWYHSGVFTPSGEVCNRVPGGTGANPEGTTPEDAPPEGGAPACSNGYPGTVNGLETCIPYNNSSSGVGETTKTDVVTNPDGSTDTTETNEKTECDSSSCKTTTSVTTNGQTTVSVSTSSRNDFCNKNSSAPVCTGSPTGGFGGKGEGEGEGKSAFGGSCEASFVCEGDAIQCAIAKEQHARNCKLYSDDTDANSLFNRAASGSDEKGADALRGAATAVDVGSFDQDGFGWSRTCPADPSFEIVGKTFSIPFSKVCPILSVLSLAALGLTLLSCLLWVVGKKE